MSRVDMARRLGLTIADALTAVPGNVAIGALASALGATIHAHAGDNAPAMAAAVAKEIADAVRDSIASAATTVQP